MKKPIELKSGQKGSYSKIEDTFTITITLGAKKWDSTNKGFLFEVSLNGISDPISIFRRADGQWIKGLFNSYPPYINEIIEAIEKEEDSDNVVGDLNSKSL